MANPQNITHIQPGEVRNPKGRGKGVPNRATLFKKWLSAKEDFKNPITREIQRLSQEDIVILAILAKARKGDLKCAEFLLDGKYGPILRLNGVLNPKDVQELPQDFSPFQVVDPVVEDAVIEIEIGAAE